MPVKTAFSLVLTDFPKVKKKPHLAANFFWSKSSNLLEKTGNF
jgi:hypothetical protein